MGDHQAAHKTGSGGLQSEAKRTILTFSSSFSRIVAIIQERKFDRRIKKPIKSEKWFYSTNPTYANENLDDCRELCREGRKNDSTNKMKTQNDKHPDGYPEYSSVVLSVFQFADSLIISSGYEKCQHGLHAMCM